MAGPPPTPSWSLLFWKEEGAALPAGFGSRMEKIHSWKLTCLPATTFLIPSGPFLLGWESAQGSRGPCKGRGGILCPPRPAPAAPPSPPAPIPLPHHLTLAPHHPTLAGSLWPWAWGLSEAWLLGARSPSSQLCFQPCCEHLLYALLCLALGRRDGKGPGAPDHQGASGPEHIPQREA